MRNVICWLLLLAMPGSLFSQFSEGQVLIGRRTLAPSYYSPGLTPNDLLNFSIAGSDGNTFGQLVLTPTIGVFLADQLLVGAMPALVSWFGDGDGETYLGISPFVRYYFHPADRGGFYAEAEYFLADDQLRNQYYRYGLFGGYTLVCTDGVSLDGRLGLAVNPDNEVGLFTEVGLRLLTGQAELGSIGEAPAAIAPGTQLFGAGNLRLNLSEINDFALAVQYGQFLRQQLVLGAGLGVVSTWRENVAFTLYELLPFVRYNFSGGGAPRWFAAAGPLFSWDREKTGNRSDTRFDFGVQLAVGLDWFITPHAALEVAPFLNVQDNQQWSAGLRAGMMYLVD